MLRSILWDVDGTLAETERDGHLKAFNQAFEALGLPWRWSERRYGELLAVAGGRERLLHDMQSQSRAPTDPRERLAVAERVHRCKNEFYASIVAGGDLPLREGVRELLEDCERSGDAPRHRDDDEPLQCRGATEDSPGQGLGIEICHGRMRPRSAAQRSRIPKPTCLPSMR